jgi:hypothetical protein
MTRFSLIVAGLSVGAIQWVFALEPAEARKWAPLDTGGLYVKAGTALDFTPFADPAPAGTSGRVVVNETGELAFASQPDKPVRFLSVALVPSYAMRFWTDEDMQEYADAVVRQGYNMVRFHIFDEFLCGSEMGPQLKARAVARYTLPETPEAIRFVPQALDRFYSLLAALKKRGVYWNIDLMTSYIGYSNRQRPYVQHMKGFNTKVQMFTNPNFRANWKAAVGVLLNGVNPYTGLALKDDPAFALASCLNEQDILLRERDYGTELDPAWHEFLTKKYGTYENLYAAWEGKCGESKLPEAGTIDQVPPINKVALTDTPAGRDMAWCCGDMESEMSRFYLETLRELGFPGLASNWNMRVHIGTTRARALFPVVTINTYHAHPLYGRTTDVDQSSALAGGGTSFKHIAMTRLLDRPFVNTELGVVFWNPYRHEQGPLFGAGAALQNWSALTGFCGQVVEAGDPIKCFSAGGDPVIRAAELVEAFAFRRRDVVPSPHTIEIPLTDEFIRSGHGMVGVDDELSRLWILCRVGITYGTKRVDFPRALSVSPDKTSAIGGGLMFSTVENSKSVTRLSAIVARLRELNVLRPENKTNPAAGIFESDTGQVTLDTASGGEMQVRTPRLECGVLKKHSMMKLDAMTINRCSVPAAVSMISIDGTQDLRNARRLLLVFSTDARNSGMKFASAKETELTEWGTFPVLTRTGRLAISLDRATPAETVTAYALKLNGERAGTVPVVSDGGRLFLDMDTAELGESGATPFFEIVVVNEAGSSLPAPQNQSP